MDHQKIGCFIAALRREKGWTQRELATRLGVTDKAVSRWETGKGLPDISLLRPLSEALGVSVNELLSGEAITPGQELAKSDAFVLRAIEETNEQIWRFRRNTLYVSGAVLLAGALIFLGFDTSLFFCLCGLWGRAAACGSGFSKLPRTAEEGIDGSAAFAAFDIRPAGGAGFCVCKILQPPAAAQSQH